MEEMDLSEDNLEEILLLLEDNVFLRWRIDYNFFNQSIYGRLFERNHIFGYENRDMTLPEIKGAPNTAKLQRTGFFQRVRAATSSHPHPQHHQHSPSSSSSSPSLATIRRRRPPQSSLVHLLQQRERQTWPTATQCYVNNIFLPNHLAYQLPEAGDKAKYCSTYSPDGRHLLVGSGDGLVTVYDTEDRNHYRPVARHRVDPNSNYTIFDVSVSPDGREFLVGSWHRNLYTCSVLAQEDVHRNYMRSHQLVDTGSKMAVFSTCFSGDGKELLASATDGCIYVYDRARGQRTVRITQDTREDVNAVRFLDSKNDNVIVGAGHNGIIEIWDRRVLGSNAKSRKSVATLFGHFDGITFIDTQDDGRHFITNSKDQSVKLWDVRKPGRHHQIRKARKVLAQPIWNYADDTIPAEFYGDKKPMDGDCSVMTYRGHRVAKTLIRAKFSPAATTGNRFIYTGCATGRVVIYDTLTGLMTATIEGHSDVVRDVCWHPLRPEIATASFDEKVHLSVYREKMAPKEVQPLRRSRRIAEKRARYAA